MIPRDVLVTVHDTLPTLNGFSIPEPRKLHAASIRFRHRPQRRPQPAGPKTPENEETKFPQLPRCRSSRITRRLPCRPPAVTGHRRSVGSTSHGRPYRGGRRRHCSCLRAVQLGEPRGTPVSEPSCSDPAARCPPESPGRRGPCRCRRTARWPVPVRKPGRDR